MFKVSYWVVVLFFLQLFCVIPYGFTEQPKNNGEVDIEAGLRKTARSLGIPPESKYYPVFRKRFKEILTLTVKGHKEDSQEKKAQEYFDKTGEPPPYYAAEAGTSGPDLLPVKHIRSTFGIPYNSAESLKQRAGKFRKYFYNAIKQKMEKDRPTREEKLKSMQAPKLPRCKKSATARFKRGGLKAKDADKVIMDVLYMDEKEIPVDAAEMFGLKTVIKPYRAGKPDVDSWAAVASGIVCLPTRLRVTGAFKYRHEGMDALRNFDLNPNGKGEIHPLTDLKFKKFFTDTGTEPND